MTLEQPDAAPPHLQPTLVGVVAVGGALGSLLRQLVADALPHSGGSWPTATFVVNLTGAFVLGLLLESLTRSGPDEGWRQRVRLFGGTGFCGGLTTYSTLAVEIDLLTRGHHVGLAAAYGVVSVLAGLVVTAAGVAVAAGVRR